LSGTFRLLPVSELSHFSVNGRTLAMAFWSAKNGGSSYPQG
jgi:hypothetical protein